MNKRPPPNTIASVWSYLDACCVGWWVLKHGGGHFGQESISVLVRMVRSSLPSVVVEFSIGPLSFFKPLNKVIPYRQVADTPVCQITHRC